MATALPLPLSLPVALPLTLAFLSLVYPKSKKHFAAAALKAAAPLLSRSGALKSQEVAAAEAGMSSKQTYRGSCAAGATANVFLSAHEATQKSRSVCSGLGRKAWGRLEVWVALGCLRHFLCQLAKLDGPTG